MLLFKKGQTEGLRTVISSVSVYFVASFLAISTLVAVALPQTAHAAGEPAITAGTNANGIVDQYINITGLQINGDSVNPIPVSLTVPSGSLSMTTTTGLTFVNAIESGRKVAFSGNKTDINNALATLRYKTYKLGSVQLSVVISDPSLVYYPGNGHLYEVVNSNGGITWDDAKVAAENLTKNGAHGYLATITTAEENSYISDRLDGDGWIGASDSVTEGDWQWVTGPDAGTSFWSGQGNGTPVNNLFSDWSSGEPNDSGNEDCAQFYTSGGWNDLNCDQHTLGYYVVEYGADNDMPVAPSNTLLNITAGMPTPVTVPIASCLDLINVADNPLNNRYDNLTLTADIDCTGETVAPLFNTTETDDNGDPVPLPFRGTFTSSAGHTYTISHLSINQPSDNNVGLISYTNGATIRNIVIDGGSVVGLSCTGGLVGYANATTFQDVSLSMDVQGSYYVGGVAGCSHAQDGNSSVTDSSYNGTLVASSDSSLGSINGYAISESGNTMQVSGNNADATFDSSRYIGGFIGEAYVNGSDSTLTVDANSSEGFNGGTAQYVGGIIGYLHADHSAEVSINENSTGLGGVSGDGTVGGQIGSIYIENSAQVTMADDINQGPVSVVGGIGGGLVGRLQLSGRTADTSFSMTSCTNTGDIHADSIAGGLLGSTSIDYDVETISVTGSHSSAAILADDYQAGGLVGAGGGTNLAESYSTGSVTATNEQAGGLFGYAVYSTIRRSYSTADVFSDESSNSTGGLAGYISDSTVEDSYARGDVTGDLQVAGLLGDAERVDLSNSYATGLVTSISGDDSTGGLVGYISDITDAHTFWDQQTTGQTAPNGAGTPEMTALMTTSKLFTDADWNFQNTWGQVSSINDGYPCLQWSDSSCRGELSQNAVQLVSAEDGAPITLSQTGCSAVTSSSVVKESSLSIQDPAFNYPAGLISFTTTGCSVGGVANITATFTGSFDPSKVVIRKFNTQLQSFTTLTPANSGLVLTVTELSGKPALRIAYQITDGGVLDQDGLENGTIVDPVGIGINVLGVPNTGFTRTRFN